MFSRERDAGGQWLDLSGRESQSIHFSFWMSASGSEAAIRQLCSNDKASRTEKNKAAFREVVKRGAPPGLRERRRSP